MDGAVELSSVAILGATGSIGRQALDVVRHLHLPVSGVAAGSGSQALMDIARRLPAAEVVIANPTPVERRQFHDALGDRVRFGDEAVAEMAAVAGVTVVNGIVGVAGLTPTVAALEAGNRVALANKESLVAGGPVVVGAAAAGSGEIIPVDSEHSALWQCLAGETVESVRRLILTASGGPFRGSNAMELQQVTVTEALAHPTWSMGPRISIDSATMMNKALEVIEAHYLYAIPYDRIEVVVHPQSIVHSLVEFVDGTVKAEMGDPDMRIPIQYALTYPERVRSHLPPFDLAGSTLVFEAPDRITFPALDLGYEAGRMGGSAPAVLNAADEVVVAAFLDGRIPFPAITATVGAVLERMGTDPLESVADVLYYDTEARRIAADMVEVVTPPG